MWRRRRAMPHVYIIGKLRARWCAVDARSHCYLTTYIHICILYIVQMCISSWGNHSRIICNDVRRRPYIPTCASRMSSSLIITAYLNLANLESNVCLCHFIIMTKEETIYTYIHNNRFSRRILWTISVSHH